MKFWKITLSTILAIPIFISILNIKSNSNIYDSINTITPTVFYRGISIISALIVLLCTVIIICTFNIIKAINNKNNKI